MAAEDFDRTQHRLRQELAARDADQTGWTRFPVDENDGRNIVFAKWTGDLPPEPVDRDMMANYNRCVIAEAANITRPGSVDWLAVGVWLFVGLTVIDLAVQGVRMWLR